MISLWLKRALILVLLTVCFVPTHAQDDMTYIYYFDSVAGGMIVERADGSDSRVFEGVYSPVTWSPLGEWFVGKKDNKLVAGRTDGTEIIEYADLTDSSYIVTQFAPATDLVGVINLEYDYEKGNTYKAHILVIDVAASKLIADVWGEVQRTELLYFQPNSPVYWTSHNNVVYFNLVNTLVTVHVDGVVRFYTLKTNNPAAPEAFDSGFVLSVVDESSDTNSRTLQIEDLLDGTLLTFEDEKRELLDYEIVWDKSRRFALINNGGCYSGVPCDGGWVVDWLEKKVTYIGVYIPISKRESDLLLSPNGKYWLVSSSYGREIILIDLEQGVIIPTPKDDRSLSSVWTSDNKLYFSAWRRTPEDEHFSIQFDPQTQIIQDIPLNSSPLFPSPDEELWAVIANPPTIINSINEIVREGIRHTHSTPAEVTPRTYRWHPNSKWVIANYTISIAGGGGGPIASVVFDVAGTTNREFPTGGQANFLPDSVIPHLSVGAPTSVKYAPVFEIEINALTVGWHPSDPNQFVLYTRADELLFWTLEKGTTEITSRMLANLTVEYVPMAQILRWFPQDNIVGLYNYMEFESVELLPTLNTQRRNYFDCQRNGRGVTVTIFDNDPINLEPEEGVVVTCIVTSHWDKVILEKDYIRYLLDIETLETSEPVELYWTADASDCLAAWSSYYESNVLLTRADTGEKVTRLWVSSFVSAFSSDGKYLATVSGPKVQIWDVSGFCEGS